MKEMVGGCCVCSDERGWAENPLVYCDGQGCNVAVHQACYGIVTVPTGPWYCRKCESQERAARVRCELCPSKEGALKRTDNNGWAHVICALYIPEVRFGNVTTMEPIVLHHIPSERYSKTCYICEELNKGSRASIGACMQCNKAGCKQQFHVTCAQAMGLLCEEAGNYQDNVKYCGYCQHHYGKLKKGGNVKTIPAYKPVSFESGSTSSDAASEKDTPPKGTKRKGSKSVTAVPKAEPEKPAAPEPPPVSFAAAVPTTSTAAPKFTASNFVEVSPAPLSASGGKKRKSRNSPTPPIVPKEEEAEAEKKIKLEEQPPETPPPPAKSPKVPPIVLQQPSVVVATPPAASSLPPQASPPHSGGGGGGLIFSTTSSHPQQTPSDTAAKDAAAAVMAETAKLFGLPAEAAVLKPRGRSQSTEKSEKVAKKARRKSPVATGRRAKNSSLVSPPPENPSTSADASSSVPAMNSLLQFSNIAANAAPVLVPPRLTEDPSVPDPTRKAPQLLQKSSAKSPKETKDYKLYQNGVGNAAPHMLGNILNPNSSMAQKMTDTLNAEMEAHSVFTPTSSSSSSSLVGPQLPSKVVASTRNSINNMLGLGSPNGSLSSGNAFSSALAGAPGAANNLPQSLDQLLERQWEQGSQFLMEQAQHFDIASLLTCLHQLRAENIKLEDHVLNLQQRRDHLLAVNARLAIPLPPNQPVTAAMRSTPPQQRSAIPPSMNNYPVENGIPTEANILSSFSNRSPVATSSERSFSGQSAHPPPPQMSRSGYYERQSPASGVPNSSQGPPPQQQQSQTSPHSNNIGTLRMNPLQIAEQFRREESRSGRSQGGMPQMQMYTPYQAVSPPVAQSSSHVPVVTSHQPMVIRREGMPMEHSNLMLHMHHHQKQS
ncbi:protein AF-10 isoform X2 [Cloeon dipterum]|uniref:protein AF-10 isoform X2 n=1 Tax=Cloeon dipterum TaxID=197152 RepID=UPI00321FA9FC